MAEPQRYIRRRYYADDHGWRPEPGTTFSEVRPTFCPPCVEWLEPEDQAASRADYDAAVKAATAMRRAALADLLERHGVRVAPRERKSDLVTRAVLLHMRRRWPVMVVA
jgi:hypothetical protein